MKSCWIISKGDQGVLEFREVPIPEPKAGELLVRMHASSLNRGELIVGGVMHGGPEKMGGTDAAGEVHAVGAGVTSFKPGDRIMGRIRGGFAEFALMDERQAIHMPPRLSWEQAAAIPVTFMTSYEMLIQYGHLARGEWLLITGVSSGVGVASIQIGKMIGAGVIGTSGSAQKLEKLKGIGLDAGIATRAPDFAAKVKDITGGKGADLIVNCVGGSVFAECVRSLAYQGRLATVGYVDGVLKSEIDLQALHANRYVLFGVSNSKFGADQRAETVRGFVRDVMPAIADGRITPVVDKVFPFQELPAAKDYVESNAQIGKVVVRILE